MGEYDTDYREAALDDISRRFADNLLSEERFETALAEIGRATTHADIETILRDLPTHTAPENRTPVNGVDGDYRITGAGDASTPPPADRGRSVVAILGERRLTGRWLNHRYVGVTAVMGLADLDLSACEIGPYTHIHIVAIMAEVRLHIPDGITITNDVGTLLSGHTDETEAAERGNGHIRLTGTALLSELKVRGA